MTTTPAQGIAIVPVPFEVPQGEATRMTVKVLEFETDAVTTGTYWRLLTEQGVQLQQGNYYMTEEQFATWGTNNNVVNQYVADAIGVTIIQ
jgi:predicted secreted protein